MAYAEFVGSTAPDSYWRLHEDSGNFGDSAGAISLTVTGTITRDVTGPMTWETARHDNEGITLTGPGAAGYGDGGDNYDFASNAPFSVALWARTAALQTADVYLVSKGTDWRLGVDTGGLPFFERDAVIATGGYLWQDEWVHLAGTYDGTELLKVYINGVVVDTTASATGSLAGNADGIRVGYGTAANNFNGSLDEVALWSRELTDSEVHSLWYKGSSEVRTKRDRYRDLSFSLSPITYWRFDQTADSTSVRLQDEAGLDQGVEDATADWEDYGFQHSVEVSTQLVRNGTLDTSIYGWSAGLWGSDTTGGYLTLPDGSISVTVGAAQDIDAGSTTHTWAFDAGSNPTFFVVGIAQDDRDLEISAMSYGGKTLTLWQSGAWSTGGHNRGEVWGYIGGDIPTGSNNMSVTTIATVAGGRTAVPYAGTHGTGTVTGAPLYTKSTASGDISFSMNPGVGNIGLGIVAGATKNQSVAARAGTTADSLRMSIDSQFGIGHETASGGGARTVGFTGTWLVGAAGVMMTVDNGGSNALNEQFGEVTPGTTLKLSADIWSDQNYGGGVNVVYYDSSQTILSTKFGVESDTTLSTWETQTSFEDVPAGAAYVKAKLVLKDASAEARFRNISLTGSDGSYIRGEPGIPGTSGYSVRLNRTG